MLRALKALGALVRAAELPDPRYTFSGALQYFLPGPFNINRRTTKVDQLQAYLGWTAAAVNLISQEVRQIGWGIAQPVEDGVEMLPAERLPGVISQPGRFMNFGNFIELSTKHLDVCGEAFWHLITSDGSPGGPVVGIEVIYPHWVDQPIYNNATRRFDRWRITVPGQVPIELPMEDVVRVFRPHPREPWRGASPVEQAALSGDLDLYAKAYGVAVLEGGGQPPGILTSDSRMDPKDAEIIQTRWAKQRNEPDKPVVLGKGMRYETLGASMKDLAWIDLSRMTRDQVLSLYGVPAAMLGLVEDVNRSTARELDNVFGRRVLRPRLRLFGDALTSIFPRIDGVDDLRGLYFHFDDPVQDDPEVVRQTANEALDRGAIMVDEYREMLGMEPIDGGGGQVYMIPRNRRVSDALDPEPLPPPPRGDAGEQDRGLIFQPQVVNVLPASDPPSGVDGDQEERAALPNGGALDEDPLNTRDGPLLPPPQIDPDELRGLNRDQVVDHLRRRGLIPDDVGLDLSEPELRRRAFEFERVQDRLEGAWRARLATLFERQGVAVGKAIRERKTPPKLRVRAALPQELPCDHWERLRRLAGDAEGPLKLLYDLDFEGRQDDDERGDLLDRVFARQARSWLRSIKTLTQRGERDGWELLVQEVDRALLSFDVAAKDVEVDAERHAAALLAQINSTTRRAVAQTVAEVLAENSEATNEEIARAVEGLYDRFVNGTFSGQFTRTDTISRTESSGSINRGKARHMVMAEDELDVRFENTWNTILDGRQREAHDLAHGQRRPLGEPFSVGGEELRYPQDPRGSAENVINCRCTTATELFDDE